MEKFLFNFNAEEQKITDLVNQWRYTDKRNVFNKIAEGYTFDEKCSLIKTYHRQHYDIKNMMELRDRFLKAVENGEVKMRTDTWGQTTYSTASVKAWCKRNGKGETYSMFSSTLNNWLRFVSDTCMRLNSEDKDFETGADKLFYDTLDTLYYKEREWFNTHDRESVLKNRINDELNHHMWLFLDDLDFNIYHGSDVGLCRYKDEDSPREERQMTLEELEAVVKFMDDYEAAMKEFCKNNFPIKSFD